MGFQHFFVVFVVELWKKAKKITGISGLFLFFPKMAVSWRISVFQKLACWNPYCYSVLGYAFFGPSCQKRKFWTPPNREWLITENSFFCFVFCLFFVGVLKGQVRWPKGPPHLALHLPYFFVFSLVLFLNLFPLFAFNRRTSFPAKRGILFIFQCLPLFLLSLFCLPLFHFLFLSFSLSLSLFLYCSFLLPSFLSFWLSFVSLFLSLCFFALFLCFCFMKKQHQNIKLQIVFLQSFLCLIICLIFSFLFSYLCFYLPHFKLCFLFNINVLSFKKDKLKKKKHQFLVVRGVATKSFFGFLLPCLQNVKSYRFFGPFFGEFWMMFIQTTL